MGRIHRMQTGVAGRDAVRGVVGTSGVVSRGDLAAASGPTTSTVARAWLAVGSATLAARRDRRYCGHVAVPLDRSDPGSPDIPIVFRWYPATDPAGGVASGTVVPVEGGPGIRRSARWQAGTT